MPATIATFIGPGLKETFTPTAIQARGFIRTRSVELATASRARSGPPYGRLQITGDRSHGAPPNAILDPTLTNVPAAMAILDDWVRQRPEAALGVHPALEVAWASRPACSWSSPPEAPRGPRTSRRQLHPRTMDVARLRP